MFTTTNNGHFFTNHTSSGLFFESNFQTRISSKSCHCLNKWLWLLSGSKRHYHGLFSDVEDTLSKSHFISQIVLGFSKLMFCHIDFFWHLLEFVRFSTQFRFFDAHVLLLAILRYHTFFQYKILVKIAYNFLAKFIYTYARSSRAPKLLKHAPRRGACLLSEQNGVTVIRVWYAEARDVRSHVLAPDITRAF